MTTREEQDRRRSPLTWAVGCLIAVVLIGAILALLNWPRVLQATRSARQLVDELQSVRSAVAAAYKTDGVFVNRKYSSKVNGPYLSIEVVDSESLRGLPREAARSKALEIATLARDSLGHGAAYKHFEVIISTSMGTALVRETEDFLFQASDLSPAPASDPD